jgi:hypothetical protein
MLTSVISLFDCGLMNFFTDEDPDYEFGGPNGIRQSASAAQRARQVDEQKILSAIQEREVACTDLRADVADLRQEAIRYKNAARRHAPGTRPYALAVGNARRALVASQQKSAQLEQATKLLGIANSYMSRAKIVDSGTNDHKFLADLRAYTTTLDVGEQHNSIVRGVEDAAEIVDSAAELQDLQEATTLGYANLQTPDDVGTLDIDGESFSLESEGDLFAALDALEEGQQTLPTEDDEIAAEQRRLDLLAQTPNVSLTAQWSQASSSDEPRRSSMSTNQNTRAPPSSRIALALDDDGRAHTHDLDRARGNTRASSRGGRSVDVDDDPFSDVF